MLQRHLFLILIVTAGTLLPASPEIRAEQNSTSDDTSPPTIDSTVGFHSYVNIGQAWGHQPTTGRVDETRYLALPALGVDLYPSPRWRFSVSGESLIGFLIPSLIVRGTANFHPFGSQSDGPFATFGARWVVLSPAIICQNNDPSCTDIAERAEAEQARAPADAIGPTINGALGEAGLGYQFSFSNIGLYALASYQGGLLGPTPNSADSDAPPLESYYHGYLVTLGLRTF